MCGKGGAGPAGVAAAEAAGIAGRNNSLMGKPPPAPVRDTANIKRRAANKQRMSGTLLTGESTGSLLTG